MKDWFYFTPLPPHTNTPIEKGSYQDHILVQDHTRTECMHVCTGGYMEREKSSKRMNRILNCEQSRAVKRKSINFWQDWIDFWTVGNGEEKMCKMATTSAACSVEKDISPKRTFPNIWPPQKCLRSRQGERVLDGNNFCSLQCKDGVFSKNTFSDYLTLHKMSLLTKRGKL